MIGDNGQTYRQMDGRTEITPHVLRDFPFGSGAQKAVPFTKLLKIGKGISLLSKFEPDIFIN